MKRYFCTYFDINFSPRGLALYDSLGKHSPGGFRLIVLVLDEETPKALSGLENVIVLPLREYFDRFNVDVTKYATRKELYFSLTAGFCLYVIEKYPEIDILFYLDADIYFYDSVEYLFTEMGEASIFITPHVVTPLLKTMMGYYGSYNVGINGFRNDETGVVCLRKWKQDCDAWVNTPAEERSPFFNDQLYLDEWPARYPGRISISANPGINLAPWSIGQYSVSKKGDRFFIGKRSVVAYHFSDLRRLEENQWDTNSGPHLFYMGFTKKQLYLQYLRNVEKYQQRIASKKYVSLNHERSSIKARIRSMLNRLTRSIVRVS